MRGSRELAVGRLTRQDKEHAMIAVSYSSQSLDNMGGSGEKACDLMILIVAFLFYGLLFCLRNFFLTIRDSCPQTGKLAMAYNVKYESDFIYLFILIKQTQLLLHPACLQK